MRDPRGGCLKCGYMRFGSRSSGSASVAFRFDARDASAPATAARRHAWLTKHLTQAPNVMAI